MREGHGDGDGEGEMQGDEALARQRHLFQGNEDRAHSGHVLRLAARLGVEVAEPCHFFPLGARAVVVTLLQEGVLGCSKYINKIVKVGNKGAYLFINYLSNHMPCKSSPPLGIYVRTGQKKEVKSQIIDFSIH